MIWPLLCGFLSGVLCTLAGLVLFALHYKPAHRVVRVSRGSDNATGPIVLNNRAEVS